MNFALLLLFLFKLHYIFTERPEFVISTYSDENE